MTEAENVLEEVIRELDENADVLPDVTERCLARFPVLTEEAIARSSIAHLLELAAGRLHAEASILIQTSALLGQ